MEVASIAGGAGAHLARCASLQRATPRLRAPRAHVCTHARACARFLRMPSDNRMGCGIMFPEGLHAVQSAYRAPTTQDAPRCCCACARSLCAKHRAGAAPSICGRGEASASQLLAHRAPAGLPLPASSRHPVAGACCAFSVAGEIPTCDAVLAARLPFLQA
jgi:hypothetical protein